MVADVDGNVIVVESVPANVKLPVTATLFPWVMFNPAALATPGVMKMLCVVEALPVASARPMTCDPSVGTVDPKSWHFPVTLELTVTKSPAVTAVASNAQATVPIKVICALPVMPAPPTTTPTTEPFLLSVVAATIAVDGAPVNLASLLTVVPVAPSLATEITGEPSERVPPVTPSPCTTLRTPADVRERQTSGPDPAVASKQCRPESMTEVFVIRVMPEFV